MRTTTAAPAPAGGPLLDAGPALLIDGSAVDVRVTVPADAPALERFHEDLSADSRLMRFLSAGVDLHEAARRLVAPDIRGLLASAGPEVVGHACLVPSGPGTAELAFAIADDWQQRGLATVLLERLVADAGVLGLTTLTADVHPSNHRMVKVFEDAGLPVSVVAEAGRLHVEIPAGVSPEIARAFEQRHRRAAVAGLDHVLRPASLAVVGASERRGSVGGEILRNLLAGGFTGALHVVHPHAEEVSGIPAVATAAELPPGVELAVVAVPAAAVVGVATQCARAGVRALVVTSAGFGESGRDGRRRQARLLDVCRAAGMRLVGPNCLGVVNTDPAVALNATFAPQRVPAGGIALASQSGAVGLVAMDLATRRGVGLSSFVSLGDRADVSSNDLLRFWADDPGTRVIALYLESFGNPRAFAEIARQVSAVKPVIAVKAGRSAAGRRAAASHTGALVEGSDALADALLSDAGVIRVDTIAELLDVATVLDRADIPAGPGIGVLTNAGGGGIACADAAQNAGVTLPGLRPATRARLREVRASAAVANPVDVLADASPAQYADALRAVAADPGVDAVVAIHIPPLAGRLDDTMETIGALAGEVGVPVVAVPLAQSVPAELSAHLAVLGTPEDAARALGHVARHARWLGRREDPAERPARIDRAAGAAVVARGLQRGGGWLAPDLTAQLAAAYGIPLVASEMAADPAAVAEAAGRLGTPIAVKAIAPGLVHKTEQGAVRLGLRTPAAARRAAAGLAAQLGPGVTGFLVQRMAGQGVELLVGAMGHPSFGPVVACGAGGTTAELWGDVQVRLAPIGRHGAAAMLRELRCFPLLRGWRGAPQARISAVEDVLRRFGALVADRPEIAEAECNPLLATPRGALGLDLRVRLVAPA
ncbi:GNAT family N-acetyltransferase [Baekduia soli]|uniref:GNAT family N-acetyltransferase n=1 Tax=Baekduia soli TaxID=496014 RepID=A0A5B8U9Q8_9ACTN|nr:bifunctional GNAT family N-acetyltransferase/acetate--CoA ligase family protein [Baekduia soli]QEC49810.1 GNAT family N-acetyltransferase [Baekduia soli]